MRRVAGVVIAALGISYMCAPVGRPVFADSAGSRQTRSVWQDPRVPKRVAKILHRSCADCHSRETHWPWYSHLAPVSWLIARDVRNGREHLDLSDWPKNPANRMEEIGDIVARGEMPPKPYTLLHPDTRLSPEDKRAIDGWISAGETGK